MTPERLAEIDQLLDKPYRGETEVYMAISDLKAALERVANIEAQAIYSPCLQGGCQGIELEAKLLRTNKEKAAARAAATEALEAMTGNRDNWRANCIANETRIIELTAEKAAALAASEKKCADLEALYGQARLTLVLQVDEQRERAKDAERKVAAAMAQVGAKTAQVEEWREYGDKQHAERQQMEAKNAALGRRVAELEAALLTERSEFLDVIAKVIALSRNHPG